MTAGTTPDPSPGYPQRGTFARGDGGFCWHTCHMSRGSPQSPNRHRPTTRQFSHWHRTFMSSRCRPTDPYRFRTHRQSGTDRCATSTSRRCIARLDASAAAARHIVRRARSQTGRDIVLIGRALITSGLAESPEIPAAPTTDAEVRSANDSVRSRVAAPDDGSCGRTLPRWGSRDRTRRREPDDSRRHLVPTHVVDALMRRGRAHLQVRCARGVGLTGRLVPPGRTSVCVAPTTTARLSKPHWPQIRRRWSAALPARRSPRSAPQWQVEELAGALAAIDRGESPTHPQLVDHVLGCIRDRPSGGVGRRTRCAAAAQHLQIALITQDRGAIDRLLSTGPVGEECAWIPPRGQPPNAKLAALPTVWLRDRCGGGPSKRIAGKDKDAVNQELMEKVAEQLFAVLGELKAAP